ncbi:rpmG, partial [Mucuna pruriens]
EKRNSFFNFNHPPFCSTLSLNFRLLVNRHILSSNTYSHCLFGQRKGLGTYNKKTKIFRLVSMARTRFFYAMKKNRKMDKFELKKYDLKVKRHVVFKESK